MLPRAKLEHIMSSLQGISHVEIIRITSRAPVYYPEMLTPEYVQWLQHYKPLVFITSFAHPYEVTEQAQQALLELQNAGILVLQQGPLLNGINDHSAVMKELYEQLIQYGVLPYYAIWGIKAPGVHHFMVEGTDARHIISSLENQTSGFCIPHLITLDQGNNKTRTLG